VSANPISGTIRGQNPSDEGRWNDDTLWSLLEANTAHVGGSSAIVAASETITWVGLRDRALAVAHGLAGLGVGKGDVVSVQLPNLPEFLIVHLATARLGAVMSTIHVPYGTREAAELMRHAATRAVVCLATGQDQSPAELMLPLCDELPRLEHVIAVGDGAPAGAVAFANLERGGDARLPAPPAADDPMTLLFTSGTSANPKGVMTDHHRYLANARLNHIDKGLDETSVMMSAPPFTHALGLYTFYLALHAGCANLLLPAFSPPIFVETIAKGRPSCVFTAPAHVAACEAAGLLPADGFPSVSYAIISGAMASPEIYRRFQDHLPNGRVGQLWGMTEMMCGLFTRPDEPLERAANWCGRASVGTELRVVDPAGAVLPPGEEGALQVRGCSVFDGYYDNDEATMAAFTDDGWFRTGDLAVIDNQGFVALTGRDKDIINRGGVKINPADVEEAIDRHPAVVQSAIVPMPDAILGEKACCFVVCAPEAALTLDDVTAWLAEQGVAKLKWPERLVAVDAMPLTPTRKVIKGRLVVPD
jgi:acyl-CoA synthetase (AMP-forming)/AMP-acid ligase II